MLRAWVAVPRRFGLLSSPWVLDRGDEVITVPSTFMATAEAITYCGAQPVFVDIDETSYTMDPAKLPDAITSRTKAIIPVHLFGQTADMAPILEIARSRGLAVIEDACQAHGAAYHGKTAGSLADVGCFSFYPGKNLGAFGEAGAVTSNSQELHEKVCVLRDHGQVRKYYHQMVGWNGRMDGIQAAILSIKLRHLENATEARRRHAAQYLAELSGVEGVTLPVERPGSRHVYHLFPIRVAQRDALIEELAARGVGTGIHYPVPVHLQECYQALGLGEGSFPVAERCAGEFVSLPMFPELTEDQVSYVAQAVKKSVIELSRSC
jgi:dTDP-4-amino-4,6-dideoxygalactose transaminase